MIKIKVSYPWGDKYLNYSKIHIVERNETTGQIYYDEEISEKTFEEKKKCYTSLQEMADKYLMYQCFNAQAAKRNSEGFISYNPYCFSYNIVSNYPDENGKLIPETEKVTRYTFMELDYNNPISNID